MNAKKAKALRRAAKKIATQFPDVHGHGDTYTDIVKQTIEKVVTRIPPSLMQRARKFFGLKTPPIKTKTVERVRKETRQLVLTSGVKFILRRLKNAIRRKELLTTDPLFNNPLKGQRRVDRSYDMPMDTARAFFLGDRAVPGYKEAIK